MRSRIIFWSASTSFPKLDRLKRSSFNEATGYLVLRLVSTRVEQKWDDYSLLHNAAPSPGMPTEVKKEIGLEIGHVLFIDIVGYSKLLINEQRALVEVPNPGISTTPRRQGTNRA
jgi:hypothetical protein